MPKRKCRFQTPFATLISPQDLQLVFLPPIGSDGRAYYRQRAMPYPIISPKHIDWLDGETLPQHARRYFDHLISTNQVSLDKPVIWGGLSLGGALAQEFSAIHPPLGQILLATFRSSDELSPMVRAVGRIADKLPLKVYAVAGHVAPIVMKLVGYMSAGDVDLMVQGYREQSKRRFRNALRALSEWQGVDTSHVPTLRLHGNTDPLIPLKRITGPVVTLETMHLITLSKPTEVNVSVSDFIDRLLS